MFTREIKNETKGLSHCVTYLCEKHKFGDKENSKYAMWYYTLKTTFRVCFYINFNIRINYESKFK